MHVVRAVDGGAEKADFHHRAFNAAGLDVVTDLERPQRDQERAGGKVRQQSAPGGADGDTHRCNQGGERGGFYAEVAEDGDDEDDVQRDADDVTDVAQQRRVNLLFGQRDGNQPYGNADQPAADDPDGDRAENLQSDCGQRGGDGVHDVLHVHCDLPGYGIGK